MIFTATPLVQFGKIDDFLADIEAGRVVGVWHDCAVCPAFTLRYETIIRALVATGDIVPVAYIASFTYRHHLLADEKGQVQDETRLREHGRRTHEMVIADMRDRLAEIGVTERQFRPGVLSIPHMFQPVVTDHYEYRGLE